MRAALAIHLHQGQRQQASKQRDRRDSQNEIRQRRKRIPNHLSKAACCEAFAATDRTRRGVAFELVELSDRQFGVLNSVESLSPLQGKFWVGQSCHGFPQNVETNPPRYRSRQQGKIERLPRKHSERKSARQIKHHECRSNQDAELCVGDSQIRFDRFDQQRNDLSINQQKKPFRT